MRATKIVQNTNQSVDTITLDSIARHRRRIRMISDQGVSFVLDLNETTLLQDGDGLELEDGRVITVIAAPEKLYRVTGISDRHLVQLAWQLGNRHLPAQIQRDHILIRQDPVIAEMINGLNGKIEEIDAPFVPEQGAYHHHHG